MKLSEPSLFYLESLLHSYGQVLLSNSKRLSLLLLIASFVDPYVGASGILSLIITILMGQWMGLSTVLIRNGSLGYNSLMVGLAMGVFYQINIAFLATLFLASFLTLVITSSISVFLAGFRLPYLSIPFVLAVWIILLGARNFEALHLSERGVYSLNELWSYGGAGLVAFNEKISSIQIPLALDVYLKSIGAIFFQYNIISGLLIAIGLLSYSRISFTLSLIGFYTGYLFCYGVQGNLTELSYSFIGFNFILSAIALGGFFLIPSAKSYLLVILTTPLISLLISALNGILLGFQLPVYSLPFSMVVIMVMAMLHQRLVVKDLALTTYQQYSPERNLYAFETQVERFRNDTYFHIHLPFFGSWRVSQGHAGNITHKEEWQYALDFVVTGEAGKTFQLPGDKVTDFYCYGLPVLAPSAGYVVTIIDNIEDNPIGEVNLGENWGNSIVIHHGDYFYSKISHIKMGSFKVKVGDYVQKGEFLALCGSSGRSPEPHIHFQLQALPAAGAKTLFYPICYFISHYDGKFQLHSFEVPEEGQIISKPVLTPSLKEAFRFIPGQRMKFHVTRSGNKPEKAEWEVMVDSLNHSYLYCQHSGSVAYFVNNETLHYFTEFKGDKNSLLYYFYLGAYKVLLGYYPGLTVEDKLPLDSFYSGIQKYIQDFAAPFYMYLKARYQIIFEQQDDHNDSGIIKMNSTIKVWRGRRQLRGIDFQLTLKDHAISGIKIMDGNLCIEASHLA